MDVPADEAKSSLEISLLGMQAQVPKGLLRMAVDQQVPVVIYVTGLDSSTGQRFLNIQPIGVFNEIEDLATRVFYELETIIAQDAPAWHFWGISERFFRQPEQAFGRLPGSHEQARQAHVE